MTSRRSNQTRPKHTWRPAARRRKSEAAAAPAAAGGGSSRSSGSVTSANSARVRSVSGVGLVRAASKAVTPQDLMASAACAAALPAQASSETAASQSMPGKGEVSTLAHGYVFRVWASSDSVLVVWQAIQERKFAPLKYLSRTATKDSPVRSCMDA